MEEKKRKELCYNCNENFTSSHYCSTQKLYVLDTQAHEEPSDDTFEYAVAEVEDEEDQLNEMVLEISYNALYGFNSPQMMKVKRYCKGQKLIILLDSSSTHNFVDPNMDNNTHAYIYP